MAGQGRRLRLLTVNHLLPNMLTVLGLGAGLTSIRFALQERWELAVAAILFAALMDGLDGRVARILKVQSEIGAQLDSLSDFLCFGVAPALVLYLWSLNGLGGFGWVLVLLYATCTALRLARFNVTAVDPDRPPWAGSFFTGLASPAAGATALLPMMISFEFGAAPFASPWLVAANTAAVALLMVSRISTFSGKTTRVRADLLVPTLLVVGILFAGFVTFPWPILTLLAIAYLGSIPWSIARHRQMKREWEAARGLGAPPAPENSSH